MKYLILEDNKILLFDPRISHKEMMDNEHYNKEEVISAGFIDFLGHNVYGGSDTLKIYPKESRLNKDRILFKLMFHWE